MRKHRVAKSGLRHAVPGEAELLRQVGQGAAFHVFREATTLEELATADPPILQQMTTTEMVEEPNDLEILVRGRRASHRCI